MRVISRTIRSRHFVLSVLLDVPEYARRSFLLDPVTDRFFACMYSDDQ